MSGWTLPRWSPSWKIFWAFGERVQCVYAPTWGNTGAGYSAKGMPDTCAPMASRGPHSGENSIWLTPGQGEGKNEEFELTIQIVAFGVYPRAAAQLESSR